MNQKEEPTTTSKFGSLGRALWTEVKREALWTGAKFALKKFILPTIVTALA
jgi:hypothetical protein